MTLPRMIQLLTLVGMFSTDDKKDAPDPLPSTDRRPPVEPRIVARTDPATPWLRCACGAALNRFDRRWQGLSEKSFWLACGWRRVGSTYACPLCRPETKKP